MFRHKRLPTYIPTEAELEPPGYGTTLPVSFRVGTTDTPPVVTVEEVQAHLKILGAFSRLKTRVVLAQETVSEGQLEPDAAWTVFLCRAVHRFEKWIQSRPTDGPASWSVVPLDVLMVWHSFMLNPLSYEGDGLRTVPQLQHLDMFPLSEVATLINPDALDLEPTDTARQAFERATGANFDPPLVTTANDSLETHCPACEKPTPFRWPWITDKVTGWAQRSFNCHCPTCDQYIDHEACGVKRFADDVAKWCAHARTSTLSSSYSPNKVEPFDFAGVTTSTNKTQINAFCQQIFKPFITSKDVSTGIELAKKWDFKFDKTETELLKFYATRPGSGQYDLILYRLRRILSHYRHPGPFSIELTSAVMRQGSFIQKMVGLGWSDPNKFATDQTILLRAIGRYHAFLDLMSSSPGSFFVPTLDIDIAWHTHQLKARNYKADTLLMLRRTPDHDDQVEENKLSNSFDVTSQAWRRRFGVPYSVCGCPVPSDVPVPSTPAPPRTSRITRISRTIRGVTAFLPGSSHKRSASLPPQSSNTRPDLVTFADDGAPDATHPSDHNAIIVMGSSKTTTARQQRQQRHSTLLERRARNVEAGTADPWTELQHRRVQREKEKHEAAFAYPIPYWGVSPYPYGQYGYGGAACGAGGGGAVPGDAAHGGATAGVCSAAGCNSNGATGGSACGSACAAVTVAGSSSAATGRTTKSGSGQAHYGVGWSNAGGSGYGGSSCGGGGGGGGVSSCGGGGGGGGGFSGGGGCW